MPKLSTNPQKAQNPFFLTCDWLQLHVKHNSDYLTHDNPFYMFRLVGQSKVFKQIYEVKDISMNIVIGQYCTGASLAIMPECEGVFKFENHQLYCHEDLKAFVVKFLERAGLKFIGITRFDVAFDFQCFQGGLKPDRFIQGFLKSKYLSVVPVKFGTYGQTNGNNLIYNQLSFGSRKSNVTYKLYNKTKELETSGKSWIKAAHELNFEDKKADVWRLEFSISSLCAFMKKNGEDFKFHSLEGLDFLNMYGIFIGLFRKYFRFKINDGNPRKTRMKNLFLWSFKQFKKGGVQVNIKRINPLIKKSSRSAKIFANKLDEFNKEFRLIDENLDWQAKDLIAKIIDVHCLHEWAQKKGIEYSGMENYADNCFEVIKIKASQEKLQAEYNDIIANKNKVEFLQATF